ncbi:DNA-processing protein DprA [Pelomonas sp. SE-A7]|uniref:DNA-processing protein DprA n=1 Tax=Pelomonas sp. SE-A7 TaxID=3054953 RepID=UPI00259CC7CE|nr:DNA-processing protein DprA [Pelomonas sp. SE-A7]MDM4766745.1 DNA-processing protein DprA [Pelomonas sp. SE-A7]
MDRPELAAWLRLLETPGLGLAGCRRLLAALGPPEAVFAAEPAALKALAGPKLMEALSRPPENLPALLERTERWLAADPCHQLLVLGDPDYPEPLFQTADPPLLLYLSGRRELLKAECVAVIGSRSPTPQGRDNAASFSAALSRAGFCIVSGLALGIDGVAHEATLQAGGSTVAVLGTGLDLLYPERHAALGRRIEEQGLLISEYALGTPPLPANFPRRNRIIAGLSRGCLVVEAALRSGSLITARLASEAGREVFAIPGSIRSPLARGCHELIRQGAALVEEPEEMLEVLRPAYPRPKPVEAAPEPTPGPDGEAGLVLEAMGHDPVGLDALIARGGWPAAQLSALLLELELEGHVARLPGQLFQRRARG